MIGPRRVDKPLVLYGYGKLGHLAEEIFKELGIPIDGVFSNYAPLHLMGDKDRLLAICIATEPYQKIISSPIFDGWTDIVPVWDILEAYPEVGIHNGWFVGKTSDQDEDGILDTQKAFSYEGCSSWHYLQFRKWHESREEWSSQNYPIVPGPSLPSTLADIRARQCIGLMHDGIWKNRIDFHLEGYEYESLVINMDLLQKHRPSLSVACYHSRDGLWKIQKFCMENLPDYRWSFRLHSFMGQGAYVYGIPNEKIS